MDWKKCIKRTVIFTGTTMGVMYAVNKAVSYISTIDNLLDNKNTEIYNWEFGDIYYSQKGKGTPLLLIHDLNVTSCAYEWHKVVNELSKSYTVYTIDLLGCGRSEKPNLAYTNYLYVRLINDFIKDVIGEQTNIIATGDAASIALMSCVNDNTIIKDIILVNPSEITSIADSPGKYMDWLRGFLCLPIIGTFIYNVMVNRKTITEDFKQKYFYDCNKISEDNIRTYFEAAHKHNTRSKYLYASIFSKYTNANILHCLKNMTNNISIIVGNANPENTLSANQYQNQLPAIEIIGIDNTKYLPQMEVPKEFLETVNILLDEEN